MPEILKDFDFGAGNSGGYPWDEWFNGSTLLLVKGEDFKSSVEGFRSTAQENARKRGLKLETRVHPRGLVIRATKAEVTRPAATPPKK